MFPDWLKRHKARFPKLDSYFAGDVTIMADWQRKLSRLSLDDLNAATDKMLDSTETIWPETQLGLIQKYAYEHQRNAGFIGSAKPQAFHNSHRCTECLDRGLIDIYDPVMGKELDDGKPFVIREAVCACDKCELGEQVSKHETVSRKGPLRLPLFGHYPMLKIDLMLPAREREAQARSFFETQTTPSYEQIPTGS